MKGVCRAMPKRRLLRIRLGFLIGIACLAVVLLTLSRSTETRTGERPDERVVDVRPVIGNGRLATLGSPTTSGTDGPVTDETQPIPAAPRPQVANKQAQPAIVTNAAFWVSQATAALSPDFDYGLQVQTKVVALNGAMGKPDGPAEVLSESTTQMSYSPDKGLRVDDQGSRASFSVDVASMLQKMRDKAEWQIEGSSEFAGQECVTLISSGATWAVRLWVNTENGAVLKYEQHLNKKHVSTSTLSYRSFDGVLVPTNVVTDFPLTGQRIVQDYRNYDASD